MIANIIWIGFFVLLAGFIFYGLRCDIKYATKGETFFCESCEERKAIAEEVMYEDCSVCRNCHAELQESAQ